MNFLLSCAPARRFVLCLQLFCLAVLVQPATAVVINENDTSGDWWYAPGVLVVEFSAQVDKAMLESNSRSAKSGLAVVDAAFDKLSVSRLEKMFVQTAKSLHRGDRDLSRYYRVTFDTAIPLEEAAAAIAGLSEVAHVEMVGVHPIDATPNDASFGQLWGLNQANDRDIDAPEAWNIEVGDSSILLGDMDTGTQWQHADLAGASPYINGNIWINWAEYNGTAEFDDDGNGYVDDIRGWDWVDVLDFWPGEDGDTPDNNPMDFNGHGTHTSGTMAAITNNSLGVAGVAGGWSPATRGCRIVPLRIGWSQANTQGAETGYVRMDFAAQAFNYATQIGVDAVNCSWGSSNSGGIQAAVDNAVANGMVICNSSGNSGNQSAGYLSTRTDVLAVASVTSSGAKSSFSNYGTWVDVSAPGSSIYSTYSNHGSATYATLSGTSMASPHVAGLAGLIRSRVPGLTAAQVRNLIISTADNIDAQNPSYIGLLGSGRINAFTALQQSFSVDAVADVQLGTAPLSVNFSGSSASTVTSWLWHFGDGDSASGQNVSHVYSLVGSYNVTLQASGPGGSANNLYPGFIVVQADTVEFLGFSGDPSQPLICSVRLKNFAPITTLRLPISYTGNMDISLDSLSVAGTRASQFTSTTLLSDLDASQQLTVQFTHSGAGIPAGDGILFNLYFHYDTTPPLVGANTVDTTRYGIYQTSIVSRFGPYQPIIKSAALSIAGGRRGDANVDGQISVSDAVYLINYVFGGGPTPPPYNGDADGNHTISISDTVFLIRYIFNGGPEPPL